ncbi:MAG: hypothetical protein ACE5KZ_15965 [Candidatus Scalinduaceae bacterium]
MWGEGKVEEHTNGLEDIKDLIINLDNKVDRRIDALDQRINSLDQGAIHLDQKLSIYFIWIIGGYR